MARTSIAPPLVDTSVSIARLHGEACWHCGAVNKSLVPAGEVSTAVDGGVRVWPVVVCAEHRGQPLQVVPRTVMQSSRVLAAEPLRDGTDRPTYIVHAPGVPVPASAPCCPADCRCRS